jgi:hypothetical protein
VHFKHTGTDCEGGTWRQAFRSTVFVGTGKGNPVPAKLVNGRYVPAGDDSYRGDWQIDTNAAGRAAKNPDYPHQDKGEMLDSPQRGKENLAGYYSDDKNPRTPARLVMEHVEFISVFVAKDGHICKMMSWWMTTIWRIRDGDDPQTNASMQRATVTSSFGDPHQIDPNSPEGKQAAKDYQDALTAFKK